MIRNNTVLILGAGASQPYKFPTTEELRGKILYEAKTVSTRDASELGLEINQIRTFYNEFYYSGTYSIDEFLSKRKVYTDIGKLLIAKVLLNYENNYELFSLESSKDWYKYLVQSIAEDVALNGLHSNALTIVTFNYDRSLERYLYLSLKNQYGANDDEIANELRKLNIIHLHGQLGFLPWQLSNSLSEQVEYQSGTSFEIIKKAAKELKIIYETDNNSYELERARVFIEAAKKVLFLGFGYNPLNLKRLQLSGKKGGRLVIGTAVGIGNIQLDEIIRYSNDTIARHELYQDCDIIRLFKEKVSLT